MDFFLTKLRRPIRLLAAAKLTAFIALLTATAATAQTLGDGGGLGGGQSISAPPADKLLITGGGVDMRTGRYAFNSLDLSSGELSLNRQMRNLVPGHIPPFGQMAHNWDITIRVKNVDIVHGDYSENAGADERVSINYGGTAATFDGMYGSTGYTKVSKDPFATLSYNAGTYTYQNEQATVVFAAPFCGSFFCPATSVTLADGTRFDLEYETGTGVQPRLRSVVSSRGHALIFEYGASGGGWDQVSKACLINLAQQLKPSNNLCPAGVPTTTYTYTSVGTRILMASSTDVSGGVTTFSYSGNSTDYSMSIKKPGASQPWVTDVINMRATDDGESETVLSQTFADGSYINYFWDYAPTGANQTPTLAGGRYVNNLGKQTTVTYDFPATPTAPTPGPTNCCDTNIQITPGPVKVTDPIGRETDYDYCDPNAMANLPSYYHNRCLVTDLQDFTEPEGDKVKLLRDNYTGMLQSITHVAKPGSGLADIVTSTPTPCTAAGIYHCSKPSSTVDAKGNQTNYTYSDVHGGVLSEMDPPPTSGAARPLKLYTYVQMSAYVKNSGGTLVSTGLPIWVISTMTQCQTVAGSSTAACDTAAGAPRLQTTYQYPTGAVADNLLPRGTELKDLVTGTARLTCFTYDTMGRKISSTSPRGTTSISVCP